MARTDSSRKFNAPARKAAPAGAKKPVQFRIVADEGAQVYLVGSFNGWDAKKHQLRFKDGAHTITVTLPKGRHEYKYLVNDGWCHDPAAPESVMNEFGSLNSVIVVD
jgi:1,4-alpha-glucan branching enzyme